MKRTTSILVCTLAAGMAWAQNPQIIQDTHAKTAAAPAKSSTAVVKSSAATTKPAAAPAKVSATSAKPAAASAKSSSAVVKSSAATPKPAAVPAKASATSAKPAVVPAKASASSKQPKVVTASQSSSKPAEPFAQKKTSTASAAPKLGVKPVTAKKEAKPAAAPKKTVAAVPKAAAPAAAPSNSANANSSDEAKGTDDDAVKDAQDKKWSMAGKRDPFISPVVSHAGGSGCSTGKKCLEIGAIDLRGVVHSDGGFIAVVTNSLNKAYFLRENDPVFDGYVVKITGDSIVFKETMQDRLGKSFTREVTKKITTPAV